MQVLRVSEGGGLTLGRLCDILHPKITTPEYVSENLYLLCPIDINCGTNTVGHCYLLWDKGHHIGPIKTPSVTNILCGPHVWDKASSLWDKVSGHIVKTLLNLVLYLL